MEALKPQQCNLFHYVGNIELWRPHKTAFLCSRKTPAAQVLKCYDWAIAMRDSGKCVMLGAHSQLEKDVLHYLLKGTQPVILVLARGMMRRLDPEVTVGVRSDRLLVVSLFDISVRRVTRGTAAARNEFMLQHADKVVVGHADPSGLLKRQLATQPMPPKYL